MRQRLIGACLVGLSIAYLVSFVPRGWVPHDEGMIGQSAERVLRGEVPHVDYEEPYTGGLATMHAALFRVAGIDLIYPRWLLFAGAVFTQIVMFLILRRHVQPITAAFGAWLALGWSFPNYFAALPSWWVLICAVAGLWAFIRYVETGLLRYVAAAGFAAGLSIVVKQTGLYILVALIVALLYDGEKHVRDVWWPGRIMCVTVAVGAVGLAFMLVSARLTFSDLIYLFVPILACSRVLLASDGRQSSEQQGRTLLPFAVAATAAAVPVLIFVAPYIVDRQIGALINGLIVLPQKRVQFAAFELPEAHWMVAGLPLLFAVMPLPKFVLVPPSGSRYAVVALSMAGALLVYASLYDATFYQMIWQSARAFAAIVPVAICGILLSHSGRTTAERRVLFGCAVFLAWASLVQVPFSAPIYFCYVTPLAVIAAVGTAAHTRVLHRPAIGVFAAVLLAFAIVSLNRGDLHNLGGRHRPIQLNEPLNLDRASLRVSRADAVTYRRVINLIASHAGEGLLVAGPDAPEVYFLSGTFSPSGTLFDFFGDHVSAEGVLNDLAGLDTARVVVLNHARRFSQGISVDLAAKARRLFPNSEAVGTLEVRWR
jgi:hypothetical protein